MAKRNKPEGKKYNYMDTYGDLVTLLLCFFVLLFSMSVVDQSRFEKLVQTLSTQFGSATVNQHMEIVYVPIGPENAELSPDQTLPENFNQIADIIRQYIRENNLEGEVHVETGASGVTFIRLTNNLLFDGNSFELRGVSKRFLTYLGECFNEVKDEIYTINCIGHTAEITGSAVDDWVLSGERAGVVSSYFEKDLGFPAVKLQMTAYGRVFPIANNNTEETRAANRRVDIVVIGNNPALLAESLLEASKVYFPNDDIQFFQGDLNDLPGYSINAIR